MAVASTHYVCDPTRTRKLLLNQRELDTLYGRINREELHRRRPVAVLEERLVQSENRRRQR